MLLAKNKPLFGLPGPSLKLVSVFILFINVIGKH